MIAFFLISCAFILCARLKFGNRGGILRFCHVCALIMAAPPVAFAYLRAGYIRNRGVCAARLQANGFIPRRIKEAQSASAIRGGARRVGRSRAGNASSGCSLKPFASFQRGLGNVCRQNLSAFRFALMRIVCAYKNCGFCRGSAKSGAGSAFSLRFGKGGAGSIKTAALLRARESRRSNRLPRACCKRPWRPGMSR